MVETLYSYIKTTLNQAGGKNNAFSKNYPELALTILKRQYLLQLETNDVRRELTTIEILHITRVIQKHFLTLKSLCPLVPPPFKSDLLLTFFNEIYHGFFLANSTLGNGGNTSLVA